MKIKCNKIQAGNKSDQVNLFSLPNDYLKGTEYYLLNFQN